VAKIGNVARIETVASQRAGRTSSSAPLAEAEPCSGLLAVGLDRRGHAGSLAQVLFDGGTEVFEERLGR